MSDGFFYSGRSPIAERPENPIDFGNRRLIANCKDIEREADEAKKTAKARKDGVVYAAFNRLAVEAAGVRGALEEREAR